MSLTLTKLKEAKHVSAGFVRSRQMPPIGGYATSGKSPIRIPTASSCVVIIPQALPSPFQ